MGKDGLKQLKDEGVKILEQQGMGDIKEGEEENAGGRGNMKVGRAGDLGGLSAVLGGR